MPFVRAGFNTRHRVIAYATIAHAGHWRARLVEFIPGGDLCWFIPERHLLVWSARVVGEHALDDALRRCLQNGVLDADGNAVPDWPATVWRLETMTCPVR